MLTFVPFHFNRLWAHILLCVFLTSSVSAHAQAQTTAIDTIHWHGFLSQGVIKTSENRFFGDSKDASWEFTDIGLGATWQPSPRLQLSAQAIYRQAGETSPDDINLDYGFLNITAINQPQFGLGFRAGRIKNPYGLYNETRDVASTRPSVLLPESIYQDTLRDLFHSSDSASIYGYREWGNILINVDVVYGKPNFNKQAEDILIPGPQPGTMENEALWVSRILLEYDGGRVRGGFSFSDVDTRIDTATTTVGLFPGHFNAILRLWSFEYNWEKWQFTTEYLRSNLTYTEILGPGYRSTLQAESYYAQISYQIDPQWQLLIRYDVYYPDKNDKSGDKQVPLGKPKFEAYAKDFTLSAHYDINSSWRLTADIHRIKGTAWLPTIENPDPNELEKDWMLYTMQISYRF